MSFSPAFQTARLAGNNLAQGQTKREDEGVIERILEESMNASPEELNNSIGKILSSVSPERQGPAIQYLNNTIKNIEQKRQQQKIDQQEQKRIIESEKSGINPYLPSAVQAAQYKENAKGKRVEDVYGKPSSILEQQSKSNPLAIKTDAELEVLTGHPDREVSENAKSTLKRRLEERKEDRADTREMRKETLPLRQKIIEEANLARDSIRNKTHLNELIDKGDIDDPTFAIISQLLPFNMGKRMLSNDTVEYKSGIIDEFKDLSNTFPGQIRVKEIEIYEDKLADLYLTDSQKKAILKSRINASKASIIREEAAAEVEEKYPNISALQFNKKVNEIAKPKLDNLINSVWDEQKSIIDQAEKRRSIPLDPKDPEDKKIMQEIKKEAGNNTEKAKELAKKKGYTW